VLQLAQVKPVAFDHVAAAHEGFDGLTLTRPGAAEHVQSMWLLLLALLLVVGSCKPTMAPKSALQAMQHGTRLTTHPPLV
jgi:hypothetical protein